MKKFIDVISNGVTYVKKVGAFFSCIAKAFHAFHDEWQVHFPGETLKDAAAADTNP